MKRRVTEERESIEKEERQIKEKEEERKRERQRHYRELSNLFSCLFDRTVKEG